MSSLTLPLLRQAVGGDPRKAEVIVVSSRSLADLDGLKLLDRVRVLTLDASHNELTDVDGLAHCAATLQHLNISHNAVARAEPLGALSRLRSLDVAHNRLTRLPVAPLAALTKLDVSHNALTADALLTLAALPLVSLDASHKCAMGDGPCCAAISLTHPHTHTTTTTVHSTRGRVRCALCRCCRRCS